MKRIILTVLGVLTVSAGADAQNGAQEFVDFDRGQPSRNFSPRAALEECEICIERALLAAPGNARENATVISWNADYTYRTLKEGSSQLVCYDRSGDPGQPAFAVACTARGNLDRIAQNRRFAAEGGDRAGVRALVAAAEANGTRVPPVYGAAWMGLGGDNQASARPHTTIAMPGATEESSGFPESRAGGGAWIMAAGSSEAHLMVPYIVAP